MYVCVCVCEANKLTDIAIPGAILFWAQAGMIPLFSDTVCFFVAEKDICVGVIHSFSLLCRLAANSLPYCCDVAELEGCGGGVGGDAFHSVVLWQH